MKSRFLILALLSGTMFAQSVSVRFDSSVTQPAANVPIGAAAAIYTVPNAIVTICGYPATGEPCTNTVQIYFDPALTQPIDNPIQADALGRFGFWITAGQYSYSLQTQSGKNVGNYPLTLANNLGCAPSTCVMLAPPTTQTVTQPAGSTLNINNLDGSANLLPNTGLDLTGGTDDSSIVNLAVAGTDKSLALPTGTIYTPTLSNDNGVQFVGEGSLLKSISQTGINNLGSNVTASKAQSTSYADHSRFTFGQEYMVHWLGHIQQGFIVGSSVPSLVLFSGDSTTAGDNVTGIYTVDQMFAITARNRGFQGVTTVNRGHSGEAASSWPGHIASDMALNPDVYVSRWGINDPFYGGTAAETITAIRTGLQMLRCTATSPVCPSVSGTARTVDNLTIVLEMPSSTNDNPTGRGRAYYEQLRNGYAQAARDYQAVFIDIYGLMYDNDFTQLSQMMDNPYPSFSNTPQTHIHPGIIKNPIYNSYLEDALLPSGTNIYASNNLQNVSGTDFTPLAADPPTNYPLGASFYRATAVNGWPYEGFVETKRFADSTVVAQFNYPFNVSTPNYAYRVNNGSGWSSWLDTNVTKTLRAFLNTTAATSDVVSVPGMSPAGMCAIGAANASGATNITTTYIFAPGTNTVTVNHAAIAGMFYYLVCTPL